MASDFDVTLGITIDNAMSEINKFAQKASSVMKNIVNQTFKLDTKEAEKSLKDVGISAAEMLKNFKGVNLPTNEIKKFASEFDNVQKSASSAMREQKSALAQLVATGQKGSAEFNQIQKELVENAKAAAGFEKAMQEVEEEIDKLSGKKIDIEMNVDKKGGGLSGLGVAGIAAGATAAFAGLSEMVNISAENEKAISKVAAATGLVGAELDKLTTRGKEAFQNGIGDSAADAITKMGLLKKQFGDVFSDKEQDKFAKTAQGIANTYDMDFNEVIQKSRTFVKNFGLDGKEANELIALGARDAGNAQGDFFDTLDEYSQLVKTAGFDGQEFVSFLTNGIKNGVRNTDKLADALKETQIRIKAGDFKTAFDGLAEGATSAEKVYINKIRQIAENAKAGKIDIKQALALSGKELTEGFEAGKISQSLRDNLLLGLTGTPAADIGEGTFLKILNGFSKDKTSFAKEGKKAADAFSKAAEPKGFEGFKRSIEGLLGSIGDLIAPILKPITKILNTVIKAIEPILTILGDTLAGILEPIGLLIGDVLLQLTPLFKVLAEIISAVLKPLGSIIKALSPVISEVIGIFVSVLVPILNELTPVISDIMLIVAEVIKIWAKLIVFAIETGKAIAGTIAKFLGFNNAGEMMTVVLRYAIKIVGFFIEAIKNIYLTISKVIDGIIKFGKSVLEFFGLIDKKVEKEKKAKKSTKEMTDENKNLSNSMVDMTDKIKGQTDGMDKMGGATDKTTKSVETLADKMAKLKEILMKEAGAGRLFNDENKKIIKTLADYQDKELQIKIDTADVEKAIESFRLFGRASGFIQKTELEIVPDWVINDKNQLPQEFIKTVAESEIENIELRKEQRIGLAANFELYNLNEAKADLTKEVDKFLTNNNDLLDFGNRFIGFIKDLKFEMPDSIDTSKLDAESEELKEKLKKREISYAEYAERLNEIDAQRNSKSNENLEMFKQAVSQTTGFLKQEFEKQANDLKAKADKEAELYTSQTDKLNVYKDSFGEVMTALAGSAAAGFGQALAEGESFGNAFLKMLIDFAQEAILIYTPQILAAFTAAVPPPPVGFALGLGAIATISGLLAVAKSKIGAEEGVIGISNNYSKQAGVTDTIPLWVAKGESIINKAATSKHSDLLNVINNNGNVEKYVNEKYASDNTDTIKTLQKLEKAISQINSSRVEVNDRRELIITDQRTIVKKSLNYR